MADRQTSWAGGSGGPLNLFDSGRGQSMKLHCDLFDILQAHLPDMLSGTQRQCIEIQAQLMLDRLSETRKAERSNRQRLSTFYQHNKHDQEAMGAAITVWAGAQQALTELAEAAQHELAKLDTQAWSLGLGRFGMPDVARSASPSRREGASYSGSATSSILHDEPPVQSIKIAARPRSPAGGRGGDNHDNNAQTTCWGRMLSGATACTVTHKQGRCTKTVHSAYHPANPHRLDVYSVETVPVCGPVSGH